MVYMYSSTYLQDHLLEELKVAGMNQWHLVKLYQNLEWTPFEKKDHKFGEKIKLDTNEIFSFDKLLLAN